MKQIRNVKLITTADIPNINGHVFTKEAMEKITKQLNEKEYPLTLGYKDIDAINLNDIIGFSKPGSAIFDGKNIAVDLELFDGEIIKEDYFFGTKIYGYIDENKNIKVEDLINLAMFEMNHSEVTEK